MIMWPARSSLLFGLAIACSHQKGEKGFHVFDHIDREAFVSRSSSRSSSSSDNSPYTPQTPITLADTGTLKELTEIERSFLKIPNSTSARENLRILTAKPHMAGTQGDNETARFIESRFNEYGLDEVSVQTILAGLTYPVSRSLKLISYTNDANPQRSVKYTAALAEPILPEDHTSNTWWRNHTFGAYVPSGNATAPLVYVNFGLEQDYDYLESVGVSVANKIVIARYGESHRGIKVKNAMERGAVGALIYSDPQQDGYSQGATYPDGPWRPKYGVQRGSMQFSNLCAGDPQRLYLPKDLDACGYNSSDLVPKIPVLPISWGDAVPLLESLQGPMAPPQFTGDLHLANGYRIGPSSDLVELNIKNKHATSPIWNVIGKIHGRDKEANQSFPIIIGNHRDAWVYGAADPNSGTAQMLEVARGLGILLHNGWRPKRSIWLCSWDGEEHGLIGSVAWGETHADELKNAIAYLNVDTGVTGTKFNIGGVPVFGSAIAGVLRDVIDPNTQQPLIKLWNGEMKRLGGGSDFTTFLTHLGIPSVDMWFGTQSDAKYGAYHSVYDSFDWVARQGDPGFRYHVAMSQVWGLLTLRLADAATVPYNYTMQAEALKAYLSDVQTMATKHEKSVDWSALEDAIGIFRQSAEHASVVQRLPNGQCLNKCQCNNDSLAMVERGFLIPDGLVGRKWFKHALQAPSLETGYGSDVFPAVMDSIRKRDDAQIKQSVDETAVRVKAAAVLLGAMCYADKENRGVREVYNKLGVILFIVVLAMSLLFAVAYNIFGRRWQVSSSISDFGSGSSMFNNRRPAAASTGHIELQQFDVDVDFEEVGQEDDDDHNYDR